jgi:hypothetical protein
MCGELSEATIATVVIQGRAPLAVPAAWVRGVFARGATVEGVKIDILPSKIFLRPSKIFLPLQKYSSPFKGEVRRGMGAASASMSHVTPSPP